MPANREPVITINGELLHSADAMTIRVAVESFSMDLSEEGHLGTDEHGEAMRKLYLQSIGRIRKSMYI